MQTTFEQFIRIELFKNTLDDIDFQIGILEPELLDNSRRAVDDDMPVEMASEDSRGIAVTDSEFKQTSRPRLFDNAMRIPVEDQVVVERIGELGR